MADSRFAITAGGMNAIMQALQALMDPGDEIIIPSPSWTNLAQAVKIIGGVRSPWPIAAETMVGSACDCRTSWMR